MNWELVKNVVLGAGVVGFLFFSFYLPFVSVRLYRLLHEKKMRSLSKGETTFVDETISLLMWVAGACCCGAFMLYKGLPVYYALYGSLFITGCFVIFAAAVVALLVLFLVAVFGSYAGLIKALDFAVSVRHRMQNKRFFLCSM